MSGKSISLLLLAALIATLLLSACGGAATSTTEPYATGPVTAPSAVAQTDTVAPLEAPDFEASCTAVSGVFPTPDPTQAAVLSLFAPVSSADWALGEQTAAVIFVEYGDFQ